MPRKLAAALACVVSFALAAVPSALSQYRGGAAPPESASGSGEAINDLYWVVLAAVAFVFVAVESVLIFFIVRFRRRADAGPDVEGPQIHGNTRLEIIWTVIPALALVALAVFTVTKVGAVQAKPPASGREAGIEIGVDAHQFYWQYRYPNGALSFDTLYLAAGRPVTLVLRAADVDHSWWVPELTGKLDAIPGQTNRLHFTPSRVGTFANGKCAEMCGIQHAAMLTTVRVLSAGDFERWLDENEPTGNPGQLREIGKAEWTAACAKCHGAEGEGDIGPRIAGNTTLVNYDGLRQLLYAGQNTDANEGYMPPVGSGWSKRQIDALISYVKSNEKLAAKGGTGGG
ncbi:MAG: cytochrome c oxidase subunit II [Actinomycetota bacterium]|nr:cytochrome c oxidase subunit II [Actinomycetota bacterium]